MEKQDQRGAVSRLVSVLRKITRIVQVAPFAYLFFLAVYLLGESFLPEWSVRPLDNLLGVPAYTTVGFLFVGRILKLCAWFRTACVLPLATKVESYVDSFVYTFTQNEVVLVNSVIGVAILMFIYLTYWHFFQHGRA